MHKACVVSTSISSIFTTFEGTGSVSERVAFYKDYRQSSGFVSPNWLN